MCIDKELLQQHINQTGLSYAELARKIDVSRNTIYNILLGANGPSHSVVTNLLELIEITPDDFVATFYPNSTFKKEF